MTFQVARRGAPFEMLRRPVTRETNPVRPRRQGTADATMVNKASQKLGYVYMYVL